MIPHEEIFCTIDDFCKHFQQERGALFSIQWPKQPANHLSDEPLRDHDD